MCLYDGISCAIYLRLRLFEVGVNGKMWRLLKNRYQGANGHVKVNGRLSGEFPVEKQRSVIPPSLFLLVMDPLHACLYMTKILTKEY